MEYASAYFVAEPYVEIYVFVDEPPSDLPENAMLIVEEKNAEKFLAILEPYFTLGYDS